MPLELNSVGALENQLSSIEFSYEENSTIERLACSKFCKDVCRSGVVPRIKLVQTSPDQFGFGVSSLVLKSSIYVEKHSVLDSAEAKWKRG